MEGFSLIVEGEEDVRFLEDFIEYHFKRIIPRTSFIEIRGKSETLRLSQTKIQISSENNSNILLFDADDKDYKSTLEKINKKSNELSLKFDHIFLFPDNHSKGNLESLLKSSVTKDNEKLFDCINRYSDCRAELKLTNPRKIEEKEKLFIYHGSFEDSGKAEGSKRSYLNKDIWDLDSPSLKNLKEFLNEFFG